MTDIDQLKKAFQQAISTSASVAASNEPLTRRDAVQSGQVFSAPVVQGGLGSWVASSGYPFSSTTPEGVQLGAAAPSRNSFEMAPGLPGVPDVDFVPYNWNTNRFGGKGGALLGHPISWEVVGPTLKSPYCDWQWNINTAGANDVLTLVAGPNPLLVATPSVAQAYNCNTTTFDAEGGLYVLLTFTGQGFSGSLTAGRNAIPSSDYRDSFEIFRVASILGQAITLRGEKRLSSYFTVPAMNPSCRAITLIRPKVTRLAPLPAPKNGVGQTNRIFVFVPPEVSATSEYNPPYDDGSAGTNPGTWLGGAFDVAGSLPKGDASEYGGTNPLPVPRPIFEATATLDGGTSGKPNKWVINITSPLPATIPPIVRVYSVQRGATGALSNGDESNCLGYFYIDPTSLFPKAKLIRVPEVNPDTGSVFWGDGPFDSGLGTVDVRVQFFESISSIFSDASLNYTKLASSRLTNLIDPRTAGPSIVYRGTSPPLLNSVPASKPDRAIFNTKLGEDPGNLLDLGFRAVYFPAKLVAGNAVPDFDNPIDSEDVQLTPNPTSRQFIETDYSAGVAYLSDAPDSGNAACQVAPSAAPFTATNNPRKEIVLFAACVPYSMEEGQTGDGIRLTASSLKSIETGFGEDDLADVYGRRIIADCLTTPGAFTPPGSLLTDLASLTDIPPSGFFFLVDATGGALTTSRVGPYYYQSTSLVGTVQLNGISGPAPAYTITADTKVVIQRSLRSFAPTSASADTVRGSSKRISTLSFKGADVTFGADGSVSVEPRTTLQKAYEAGRTIDVTAADGGSVRIRTADEPSVTNLSIQKLPTVASTSGVGLAVGMNANTSGKAIEVLSSGEGAGISVSHLGTLVGADGILIYQGAATSAYGLRVEMSDPASAGYGVSIQHNGTYGALQISHAGTVGAANGAEIGLTGATAATGLSVNLSNAGATGDALSINNSGSGRGIFLQTGTGNAIEVYDSAPSLRVSVSSTGLVQVSDGGLNSGAISPFSSTISDGTNTSTVDATSVTSDAFLYPAPVARIAVLPLSSATPFAGTSWAYDGEFWEATVASDRLTIDLGRFVPQGATITKVEALVTPGSAGRAVGNRMKISFFTHTSDWTTPTSIYSPVGPYTEDNGVAALQVISHAPPVLPSVNNEVRRIMLQISSGLPPGVGDRLYSLRVFYDDPGPRNY